MTINRFSFVYNMTEHCNLTCHGCDHAAPLMPEKFASFEQFQADLTALREVYRSKQMRITGGEPTLHPRLLDFVEFARSCGIADWLVLVTNGVLLHKAPERLWTLVDEIWLSVYPQVKLTLPPAEFSQIAQKHNVLFTPVFQNTFFTTLLNNRVDDPALVDAVYRSCKMTGEWSCHTVHEGRYYKCSPAPFMGRRLARLGIDLDSAADSVPIHAPNLQERLERYLADDRPLKSCSYCLGTSGPEEQHHLLNRRGIDAWSSEDHNAAIQTAQATLSPQTPSI
jgi:organic radical activating enzyme